MTITREQEAGKLYTEGRKAVQTGGLELHTLAMHLILMIKGTAQFPGPLWPMRELSDGKIVPLDRFVDYLLRPVRDGLELPSMYFLKQTLEATVPAKDGDRALAMVRAELAKEHVDFDAQAKLDEMRLHGEREPASGWGGDHGPKQVDNINLPKGGTRASYLAARIKRERPDISERLAKGEFKSVRAAAIEAGIITPPTLFEQFEKLVAKMSDKERVRAWRHLDQLLGFYEGTNYKPDPDQIPLFP